MEQNYAKERNLTMTGSGSSNGGTFNTVKVTGESNVDGDLTCNQLRVMGTVNVRGNAKAKWTRVMGQVDVGGDLSGDALKVLGNLSVKGDCNSEALKVRGTFNIDGLLNAGKINVRLFGPSLAKEIGGGHIVIQRKRSMRPSNKHLTVETVEGDDIRLQCTRAKVVRGNRVEIGPGCDIELVEYKEHYSKSNRAKVKEAKRV